MYEFLQQLQERATKEPDGTFVGVRLSKETMENIQEVIKKNDIPNPVNKEQMHVTVIYSRKYLPEFKSQGKLEKPIVAKPDEMTIFPARNGTNALVLKLKSPELTKRHKQIMKEHEAVYDFDEYRPHVTLSYDAGDFDANSIDVSDFSEIEITEEYDEDLKMDWLANDKKDRK